MLCDKFNHLLLLDHILDHSLLVENLPINFLQLVWFSRGLSSPRTDHPARKIILIFLLHFFRTHFNGIRKYSLLQISLCNW